MRAKECDRCESTDCNSEIQMLLRDLEFNRHFQNVPVILKPGNRLDWQHKGTPAMLPQDKLLIKDSVP